VKKLLLGAPAHVLDSPAGDCNKFRAVMTRWIPVVRHAIFDDEVVLFSPTCSMMTRRRLIVTYFAG
jgi:hypothetical protein